MADVSRRIYTSFWEDTKVVEDMTPEDRYFYIYLLTNPHTTLSGCYEVGIKQICRETGYNDDTVYRLLKRMEEELGVICYDKNTREILIINWSKYNWTKSPKLIKGVEDVMPKIKNQQFRQYVASQLTDDDTVSIQYPYTMDTSTTNTISITTSNTKSNTKDERILEMSENLKTALEDWIQYKTEKRQPYKPIGLKSLVTQVISYAQSHGDDAVADVIRKSMSANYQGIVWDWLKKTNTAKDRMQQSYDMMERWANG